MRACCSCRLLGHNHKFISERTRSLGRTTPQDWKTVSLALNRSCRRSRVTEPTRRHFGNCRIACAVSTPGSSSSYSTQYVTAAAVSSAGKAVDANVGYKRPPREIAEIIEQPPQPTLSFSPDRKMMLQLYRPPPYPPVTELARPELKLAGLRIDADKWSRSRMTSYHTGISVAPVTDELMVPLPPEQKRSVNGIPPGYVINYVSWSPDSSRIVFALHSIGAPGDPPRAPLQLWTASMEDLQAKPLLPAGMAMNTIYDEYAWVDDTTLVATVIPADIGPPPKKSTTPPGPKIQDNSDGKSSQVRTFQDLLKDGHDEEVFEYYSTSSLVLIDSLSGEVSEVGPPRMYTGVAPSPDGAFLLVSWMERPFSFTVPCGRFPKRVQLWDRQGALQRELAYLPLAEDIPINFNSCRKGPRGLGWRDDKAAQLYWVEAQDEGDPTIEVSPRDIVYTLPADSASNGTPPQQIAQTELRYGGIVWGDGDVALLYQSWWKSRRSVVSMFAPDRPEEGVQVLFDRNYEDVYSDPGSPAMRRTSMGTYVLAQLDGQKKLIMQGTGASPKGNRPFVDILDLETRDTRRVWQSSPPYYESTGSLLSDLDDATITLEGLQFLLTRESVSEPPQYYIMTISDDGNSITERRISDFPHPYPTLKELQKEIIRYSRDDGAELTATLYLPPGYDKQRDGPLPCLMWAYPREFKSKDAASQLRRSPHEFSGIGATSPLMWLARKFAVLDGPTMPIIAEGDDEPNDSYVHQLTASARAAVEELKSRGLVDPSKIAIGGHSYGAFMAANLLAHAPDLFCCGIARSGAYNRTLTPFGFQAEERTLWQATDTYITMSPFMQADKIKKPLLLIHGEDDNNTGTFPMQSERFYGALKGHGATCRLVVLPHESHGYRAKESILHTLYEMDTWLEQYCNRTSSVPEDGSNGSNGASGANGSTS